MDRRFDLPHEKCVEELIKFEAMLTTPNIQKYTPSTSMQSNRVIKSIRNNVVTEL